MIALAGWAVAACAAGRAVLWAVGLAVDAHRWRVTVDGLDDRVDPDWSTFA